MTPPPHPPIDAELLAALVTLPGLGYPPTLTSEVVQSMRAASSDYRLSDDALSRRGTVEFDERLVPGPAGAPNVSLLICRPAGVEGPLPVVYFVHGGGMMLGDNRSGIDVPLDWMEAHDFVLVSVEYRLAPENPHPAPVEDCYAGLVWTAEHVQELGGDAQRIVIAGVSAGGGIAAAVTLMARDRGGPALIGQLLDAPMLDDRNETVSSRQVDGIECVWNRAANELGWTALVGEARGGSDVSPYAAPSRARDLSGLAGNVHRRRRRRGLPRRGGGVRVPHLGGWRGRGTARLGRRVPRLRLLRTGRGGLEPGAQGARGLARPRAPRAPGCNIWLIP